MLLYITFGSDFAKWQFCFAKDTASDISHGRTAAKSRQICEIHKNTQNTAKFGRVEILSNTCLYSNFETCLSYLGYLLAVNSQIYLKTSSRKCANNVPKLPGVDYDVKGFAIGSFLERIVVERANDDLCKKNIKNAGLISAINRSISSEIFPENNHKICYFCTNCFPAKFAPKIPTKFPRNRPIFLRFCL